MTSAAPTPGAAPTENEVATPGTAADPARLPWRGRIFTFVGLILLAFSLRHAVTGVSPLLSRIEDEVDLGAVGTTILGMLPTIAFGLAGFAAPALIRRWGPAWVAVGALLVGALGTATRVIGDSPITFLGLGLVALLGLGVGNVVGPPLVKKYFPDRQAAAMSRAVLSWPAMPLCQSRITGRRRPWAALCSSIVHGLSARW